MKILKVSVNGMIEIEYSIKNSGTGGHDKIKMISKELATDDFYSAVNGLVDHLVYMCDFPESAKDRLSVTGAVLSYGADSMSAIIKGSCNVDRAKAGFSIKSPQYTHYEKDENTDRGENKNVMTPACFDALNVVIEQCKKYVSGERSQRTLDLRIEDNREEFELGDMGEEDKDEE